MRIHLIKKQTIEEYVLQHADTRSSFENWLEKLKHANLEEPNDIVATYGSADILGGGINRVVFNIRGNNYRMICKYVFGSKEVHLFVCWIGTHGEYTKLCDDNKQYTVNKY